MEKTDSIPNEVVLCGSNNFNCYGMLRSLASVGIYPTLVLNKCKVPFVAKSKYAKSPIYFYDSADELPALIRQNIKPRTPQAIIICCDDLLQSALDMEYNSLKDDYLLSSARNKQGEITRLMDKYVQMDIANECGLAVPKSWFIRKGDCIPDDMIYPCIVKPDVSITGSKSEIQICHNSEELMAVVSKRDYLVQEFIEKEYEAIVFGTWASGDKYYMPVVTRKIRHYPDDNGLSSYGRLESFGEHPGLDKSALIKFLRALDYKGMFSIELAVKGDKYYLLEINLRNDGKQYFSTVAGANLPWIYIESLLGHGFQEPKLKLPIQYMLETGDIFHVLRGKISLWKWLDDLMLTNTFFILNSKDIKPFVYKLIGKM